MDMWSLGRKAHNEIRAICPQGTILELGSGDGSAALARTHTVYSVEHDDKWVNRFGGVKYIYAPITDGWYDRPTLQTELPHEYDFLIVDGPTSNIGRGGFLDNLSLFRCDVPVLFDDVNREADMAVMQSYLFQHGSECRMLPGENGKWFAIVYPKVVS